MTLQKNAVIVIEIHLTLQHTAQKKINHDSS
jgi:hypothetical protein